MRKILIAFDGNHFSESTFDFVRRLNDQQPILATGVFLPAVDFTELLYSLGGLSGPIYFQDIPADDMTIKQKNIDRFSALCLQNGIEYRVHPDIDRHVISEIKIESRFADLLVVSSELFYENLGADTQSDYIENVLHKAECPVVLVPELCHFPDNVILAYDGSESAVYAIKQLAYILPEFARLKTILVFAGPDEAPDMNYITELAARHYPNLTISHLDVKPKNYFNTWLEENGDSILVTGAYSRSTISEMLKKSFITDTINDHRIPLFITHK